MVAAAGGVGRTWPAVSKAPREAHVAPKSASWHRGTRNPPPTGSCSESAAQQPEGSPSHGDQGPGGTRGTRGTRGTGTSSRWLRGCSEEGRILHFRRQRASWSAGEARETLPFPHGGNIRASPTAGSRSGIFLGAREAQGGLPSWPRSAPRARACCVSGFEDGGRGWCARGRAGRGAPRARAHCLSESLRFTDMHRHCLTFWIFLSRKGGSRPGQSSSTRTEATRCGLQKAHDWKDASSWRTWRGM